MLLIQAQAGDVLDRGRQILEGGKRCPRLADPLCNFPSPASWPTSSPAVKRLPSASTMPQLKRSTLVRRSMKLVRALPARPDMCAERCRCATSSSIPFVSTDGSV
jgi:hypothetical protein